MATDFSVIVLGSLLRALVGVFPHKDQLCADAADVGGIWRMMEATGERASDPQSPFHQVADEMLARLPYCISIPKPLLGSVLRQTAKNLDLIHAKVARHGSDGTIGLVDLCTRQDALANILGAQHVCRGVYGLQAEVFTLFDIFQKCSFLCLEQQ